MGWFFVWILFGVVCAVVASGKGRSGVGWFFLGLLLGPIGLILSLVVSKNVERVESRAIAGGGMRKCPYCAELVKSEAVLCRYCGKDLPAEKATDNSFPVYGDHVLATLTAAGCTVLETAGQWVVTVPGFGTRSFYSRDQLAEFASRLGPDGSVR